MQRLRPEDDYFLRCETDGAPMHIGALQRFDAPAAGFAERVLERLDERLGATPLAVVRHRAPDEYDADAWGARREIDLADQVTVVDDELDPSELRRLVEQVATERLDPTTPPFHLHVVERTEQGRPALVWRVHHAVVDGIGFQNLMSELTDGEGEHAPPVERAATEVPPPPDEWLAASAARFEREEHDRRGRARRRERVKEALGAFERDPANARRPAGRLARVGPSSAERCHATLDLSLPRVRAIGRALGGTVNDVLLSVVSGAVRQVFDELGELPDAPILATAARSYRRPEHGPYGNRILNLTTSLATDVADPIARFAEIRRSIGVEIARSQLLEGLLDDHDRPHGARRRREQFESQMQGGRRVLPGPIVVSNVPGPESARSFAGHRLLTSHPVPLLGYGRLLNVTSRRYVDELQCGVMTDAAMLPDIERVVAALVESFERLESAAG